MKLRPLLAVVPALVLLKLTACSDNGNSSGPAPGPADDGGGSDAPVTPPPPPSGEGGLDGGPGPRGSCTVTSKGTGGLLFKGRLLLPESIVDGELLIDAKGTILCADASCTATPTAWQADTAAYQAALTAATKVTCKDAIISPGLINPHDHITFANTPPKPHGTERYEHRHDWRKGLEGHAKITTAGTAPAAAVSLAELRFVMSGTTAGATAGGESGLMRNVDDSPASLEGARVKIVDSSTFPLNDSTPPTGWPNVTCANYSTAAARDTATTVTKYDGYLPHISEGIEPVAHLEMQCQTDSAGDPTHFLLAKQTAVIHGIGVNADDIAKFRTSQTALIWSPRSNVDLYGNTAPVVAYDNLGVQIALGTDWLPSGSMNMSRELRCADTLNQTYFGKHFTDKALWKMVTQNAAFAIGAKNAFGMLKPGYAGDIAIFDSYNSKDYRAVIDAGVEDVILTMRGGVPLYGDSALLTQDGIGGSACEDLPVCGVAKKACVKQDLGTLALADLQSSASSIYPMFFCKKDIVKDEPSCVPYRGATANYATASVYTAGPSATDKDGDGVADAQDNCPSIFNPIRPQDGTAQADTDGDGIGDACDKCPTEAGETCTPPSADDLDGDTVVNGTDNCPEDANTDQADADGDGKGDVCDPCPADANPGQALCPKDFLVPELRDPTNANHPASDSVRARVKDLYVTALVSVQHTRGFFAQVDTNPFGGLFVSTDPAAPTVAIGNKVDVEGDYTELFNITTLANPKITVTDPGTMLPFGPSVFTAQQITNVVKVDGPMAEQFESMLCEVDTVTVSNMNPDAPKDFDELAITDSSTGILRVDDYVYDALDNTYAVATPFSKVVGICGFSFSNRKLWPRSAADLVP